MTPGEFRDIVKTAREFGLSHVKLGELEFHLSVASAKGAAGSIDPIPTDSPSPAEEPIKHQIEQLASLMKLSDTDLVDKLFPEPEPPEESA